MSLRLVRSVDDAAELLRWLSERRDILAFDVETEGLKPERDRLRLVQFGDETSAWSIPWDHWGGVALEVLRRYEGPLVGHHSTFDVKFLEKYGKIRMPRERIHDTQIKVHLIDPTTSTALKPWAAALVDPKAAYASKILDKAMTDQGWTWATVPIDFESYWAYGGLDCVLTACLWRETKPLTVAYERAYELERAAMWVCMEMETRGMRVDLDYCQRKRNELDQYCSSVESWVKGAYGVSPGSNTGIAKLLIAAGHDGLMGRLTPTGQVKLDAEALEEIVIECEQVKTWMGENGHDRTQWGAELEHCITSIGGGVLTSSQQLAYGVLSRRRAQKVVSAYLDNLLESADSDGFVHPSIRTLGARTGRMSITDPALQTLPRGRVVRDAFIPDDEDQCIVTCDWAAIEMRLLAHFAQDQAMAKAIMSGDIHTETAKLIYNDPSITKKDPRRALTKNASFGKAYGAGISKFALTAGITEDLAQAFMRKYDETFPGIKTFQHRVEQTLRQRLDTEGVAYITTPMGRKLLTESNKLYTGVNYLIQAHAGEVLKRALVDLDQAGFGPNILCPIHDEVVATAPRETAEEFKHELARVMTYSDEYIVPLEAEASGPYERWGGHYA